MSGTPYRTTDPTREWSGRNTSLSVDPGAGNPVSKPGQLQCACSVLRNEQEILTNLYCNAV